MTEPASIDYSPLDKMHHSGTHVFKTSFNSHGIAVFVLVLIASIALATTPISQVSFMVLFVYIAVLSAKINAYKNHIWQDFAAANGWPAINRSGDADLPPSTNYGHSRNYGMVVKAQLGQIICAIFTYDTTTGEGKYQTTHYFTVASVALPKNLPHIILNSKKDKADIQTRFPDYEKLKLEGDFNNYFNLLISKGQEIDALAILTPDVMQTLISANADEDIEINGQQLYFILRNDKRDTESIKKLIASTEALANQIIQNISLSTAAPQPTTQPNLPAANPVPSAT